MGLLSTQSGPRKVVQLVGNSGFHRALSYLGNIATLHEQIINLQRIFIEGTILQTENQGSTSHPMKQRFHKIASFNGLVRLKT
jgi:hypothetical protein